MDPRFRSIAPPRIVPRTEKQERAIEDARRDLIKGTDKLLSEMDALLRDSPSGKTSEK
jgi:hypothetical protein